jgi:hypothetical protein
MFSSVCSQLSVVMYTVLSPDPAVQSLLKPSQQSQLAAALNALLTGITSTKTPLYIIVGLLDMLTAVNSQVCTGICVEFKTLDRAIVTQNGYYFVV